MDKQASTMTVDGSAGARGLRRLGQALRTDPSWLVLLLLLLPFWIYKLRDLGLPYFWDELGVYGRAAVYMHDHVLGLQPRDLPPDLSRGHPLLLPFVFASIFRIFAATPFVAHVAMLLISTGLVVSVFWIARVHWNAAVGLAAALVLLAQPLFLAQSTLLLPEIPLALACLWAMHAFSRKQFLRVGIFVAVAIFLKETAVALDAVLGLLLVVQWLRTRPALKTTLPGVLALTAPGLLYGLFLVVQRFQNGWFFFPFHIHQVNFHWWAMKGTLYTASRFLFVEQGRAALSVVVALWLLLRLLDRRAPRAGEARFAPSLAWVLASFTLGYIVFSAGNVLMKRYLMCLIPPMTLLGGRALSELVREQTKVLFPAAAALGLVSLVYLEAPGFNCAYDMSYRQSVLLQEKATRYLENTVGTDKPILANFPTGIALVDPRFGYAPKKFAHPSYRYSPQDQYIFASELYSHFIPPPGVHTRLMKRFSSPYMNIALYRIVR